MTAAELRALLADLDDTAPVLVDGEYAPGQIKGFDVVLTENATGRMVRSISLIPERDDADFDP